MKITLPAESWFWIECIREAGPVVLMPQEIEPLDAQWIAIETDAPTIAHEDVARWLETWGMPAFRRWRER